MMQGKLLPTLAAWLSTRKICDHLLQAILPDAGKVIRSDQEIHEVLGTVSGNPFPPVAAIVSAVEHAEVFPVEGFATAADREIRLNGN
jgi:hypothetical protein